MKLSEKFLDRISHSTEFSKPVVLTRHVKLYGKICNLEGHEEHAQSVSSRRHYQKELERIAKENNL